MKKFNQWLVSASILMLCSHVYAETSVADFLTRMQSQQINTQVISLATSPTTTSPTTTAPTTTAPTTTAPTAPPTTMPMYMGKPTQRINIDTLGLFDLADFKIELPGLEDFYAVKEKVESNRFNGRNWIGDVIYLDPYGFNTGIQGRAYFVENNGKITGAIHTPNEIIQIFPDNAGGQLMISSDPAEFESHNDVLMDENSPAAAPAVIGNRIDGESPATPANPYSVDVMYVVSVQTAAEVSDVAGLIELSLVTGNDVLANSLIPMRLQWVGTHFSDYQESDSMNTSLSDLKNTDDGQMDEVHALRESLGADMVMLVSAARNYCGLAYVDATPAYTFSATAHNCMSGTTPIHELGHNFGAMHDRDNGSNSAYSFGYGLQNTIEEPYWRTVMAYSCGDVSCPRLFYFSTPEVQYNDLYLGDPVTFDNGRVLRVRAAEVAGYFPHIISACREHSATNSQHVSAGRAYTQVSGGFFQTTRYYALGSDDDLGVYGFLSSTLHEQTPSYFTTDSNCQGADETAFAPEVQNLRPSVIPGALRIEGEVFDANSDVISAVELKLTTESEWLSATLSEGNFSVDIPVLTYTDVSVEIRTSDSTGLSFTSEQTFTIELLSPPILEHRSLQINDQRASFYMHSANSDNPVTAVFYQIGDAGIPGQGTWTPSPVSGNFWTLEINDIPVGEHTIYVYGVDSANQLSNVLNASVNILAPQAPLCVFAGAIPSTSGIAGEVDLYGFSEDINYGDIFIEYRINAEAWTPLVELTKVNYRESWFFHLPQTFTNGQVFEIETRATDSTNLQTDCGTVSHTVTYPEGDEAPSCRFTQISKDQGVLLYYMLTSDPNGDQQRMYAKEASQSEWLQTWPHPLTAGNLPIPGFGDFTIQGRVVDSTNLEGFCEQTITIIDEGNTPTIEGVFSYFDDSSNSSIISINVIDLDGEKDVASVQLRQLGAEVWLSAFPHENSYWHYDLGQQANGTYSFEARASDNSGHTSALFNFDVIIDREIAPVLSNVTYLLDGRNALISGEAFDANGDLQSIFIKLNDFDWFSINASAEWNLSLNDLQDGVNTLLIYARDASGLNSPQQTLSINIEPGTAPTISTLQVSVDNLSASIIISATDADDDISFTSLSLDGGDSQNYSNQNSGQWNITYTDLAIGSHQIQVSVSDSFGNISAVATQGFEIAPTQACFTSDNSTHVNEGRASTRLIGQTCYGAICFGGTTTYFANGSDNNMGTSANTSTTLIETSTGFFEIGSCPVVDTTPPVITLNGSSPMNLSLGSTFSEPGATANDDVDGDISSRIVISGNVNTAVLGVYTLTYNVSDTAGNTANEIVRTINVVEGNACFTATLALHTSANRAYEQYSLYYATGTATYLGSTYTDANKIVSLEESSVESWSVVTTCN